MRIAILCDGIGVTRWQRAAIAILPPDIEIDLLVAAEGPGEPRRVAHGLYYALNLIAIRNRLSRRVPFPDGAARIGARFDFTPAFDGRWASLTPEVLDWLRERKIAAVVKFGLGLLRVPDEDALAAPILSFHHGDPRGFRGRPAGFYELANGERYMGQIVQRLSNRLDAGTVLAFAQSRVVPHSYRQTLIEAWRLSPFLLPRALEAVRSGTSVAIAPTGTNYRLPGNAQVARFVAQRVSSWARRMAYGATIEKRWKVATVAMIAVGGAGGADPVAAVAQAEGRKDEWAIADTPKGFNFLADPFFAPDGSIFAEALHATSGKGALVQLVDGEAKSLTGGEGHFSYPGSIEEGGATYLVPEIAGWSEPAIYRHGEGGLERVAAIDIEQCRLLDPTLLRHEGRVHLFANRVEDGPGVLHLWSAEGLFGRFERHPSSPDRIGVRGSRMAGQIERWGETLFRLGQDWVDGYGDGIVAFPIETLTADRYREGDPAPAAFGSVRGPLTLNRRGEMLLFDFYEKRFAPLAGLRRIAARI